MSSSGYTVSATGSGFISGETWVERFSYSSYTQQCVTTVLNSSTLQFSWPSGYPYPTDWTSNEVYANNSSSMPGECSFGYLVPLSATTVDFMTVNPPQVWSILGSTPNPPTLGGIQSLIVPSNAALLGYIPPGWSYSASSTSTVQVPLFTFLDKYQAQITNYNTSSYPGSTGSLYTWPAATSGVHTVQFGYPWRGGTNWNDAFLGVGLNVTYQNVYPMSLTVSLDTNVTYSVIGGGVPTLSRTISVPLLWTGYLTFRTPYLYYRINGGVPPYTVNFTASYVNWSSVFSTITASSLQQAPYGWTGVYYAQAENVYVAPLVSIPAYSAAWVLNITDSIGDVFTAHLADKAHGALYTADALVKFAISYT
jgi:hypothetical protein